MNKNKIAQKINNKINSGDDKMDNILMKFEGHNVEIIKDENGEPLFELYSTGMALGYKNKRKNSKGVEYISPYKSRIDKTLKNGDITCVCHGVTQYLTEENLYDFMLEAKTEKCKPFRKWVVKEVLPSIRKHGAYMTRETLKKALTTPDFIMELAKELKAEQDKNIKLSNINAVLEGEVTTLNTELEEFENLFSVKDLYDFNELAKFLANSMKKLPNGRKMGRNNLMQYLRQEKVLMESNTPYQRYLAHFKVMPVSKNATDKKTIGHMKTYIRHDSVKWMLSQFRKNK